MEALDVRRRELELRAESALARMAKAESPEEHAAAYESYVLAMRMLEALPGDAGSSSAS